MASKYKRVNPKTTKEEGGSKDTTNISSLSSPLAKPNLDKKCLVSSKEYDR